MTKDQIERLQSIDFIWDINQKVWNKTYLKLKAFFEENGHSSPSTKLDIYWWVFNQRKAFQDKKLDIYKIKLLKNINFEFTTYDKTFNYKTNVNIAKSIREDKTWYSNYQLLQNFLLENNNKYPSYTHPTIGFWTNKQRMDKRKGSLSQDKINLMEKLPFWYWNPGEDKWYKKYNLLKEFKIKNNHTLINTNKSALGRWVGQQRYLYRKNKLSREKINLLEKIDFIWEPNAIKK